MRSRGSLLVGQDVGFIFAFFIAATLAVASVAAGAEQPAIAVAEADDSETSVDIPDAALRKALEKRLRKDPGEIITRGEMASIGWLSDVVGVEQLAGIEHAVNLRGLSAYDGAISDVSPLAGLTSLLELYLYSNEISDVSPLAGLTSLLELYLYDNEISDVSPLRGLTSLRELVIGGNNISDVSPLAGLTLERLGLSATPISDVSPLAGMKSLESLSLGSNHNLTDLWPLAGLTSLWYLYLYDTPIWDLSPLADLRSLTFLRLGNAPISDLSPLAGLKSLEVLAVGSCYGVVAPDLAPLAELTSLRYLGLDANGISDVSPLLSNAGLGPGDRVLLRSNPLSFESVETHVPMLLERGVDVQFDPIPLLPDGAEVAEISDPALRSVFEAMLGKGPAWPIAVYELLNLGIGYLDGAGRGIRDLSGLELATNLWNVNLSGNAITDLASVGTMMRLRFLDVNGNDIKDIAPLAGLPFLRALSLRDNKVEHLSPLADLDGLYYLALDGNSVRELPALTAGLAYLHLTDNSISDIAPLANLWRLIELRVSGNSITSLSPLAGMRFLRYLHANDNQVTDIAPLNFESLAELHLSNNAVRDISPLLNGEKLLMVDVRGNPLSGEAMSVLEELRERRVTVLAGETVPYFPAAGVGRQGFVRIVNRSEAGGEVFIEAVDDAGVRVGPVRLQVGARRAVHFNSADLENGNAAKGFGGGIGRPTAGDWRLDVVSSLDVEVLSYIRTEDGFVTAMHDIAPDAMLPFFNPGSNQRQQSTLRVVNTEAEPAMWVTGGYDDRGRWHAMAGSIKVRPQHALTLTAQALENAHGLGDGAGKWRLRVRGFPWLAMSLLESPTGHLTNLSTVPNNAEPLADGGWRHRVPLFLAAGGTRAGFLRVVNRSNLSGEVAIEAVDDEGNRAGPVFLELAPRQTAHFNSDDLEAGNNAKGLAGGIGTGEGDWRLALTSELDLRVLSYIRTTDGFLTSMHDLAPRAEDGSHRVVFFNPGSNTRQVSKLRLINNGDVAAQATIAGVDDGGSSSGVASVAVPAASALTFTAAELEAGSERLSGRLGDGGGKWRLRVAADAPLAVMSLLETPTGHLANVSTGTAD